jgi:hypothetical protein
MRVLRQGKLWFWRCGIDMASFVGQARGFVWEVFRDPLDSSVDACQVPLNTGATGLEPVALDRASLLANNMAEPYLAIHQNRQMEGRIGEETVILATKYAMDSVLG